MGNRLPEDFLFGCATASYQVEGAAYEDGRTSCIWDDFASVPGNVADSNDGRVAADQYHHYIEDIEMMHSLGFMSYRFSISWSRVFPNAGTVLNEKGIGYYRNICRELHKRGMKACVTLYHWDLPSELQAIGGWTNREIAYRFADYAEAMFRELDGYADMWITLNEPYCISYLGHLVGVHAPGHRDLDETIRSIHTLNLAHGLAVQRYRAAGYTAPIGITLNPSTPRPGSRKPEDRLAADHLTDVDTGVFIGPLFRKEYPKYITDELGWNFPIEEGDMDIISQKLDFLGINYYSERAVAWNDDAPYNAEVLPSWQRHTHIGWPVEPKGLYRMLMFFKDYVGDLPLYITENGSCEDDVLTSDGRVHDYERIDYLREHYRVCADAIRDGVNLKGHFTWSFIDNYEWAEGYTKRFGIVYCDYRTLKRYPKDSAYFIRDYIAGYAE